MKTIRTWVYALLKYQDQLVVIRKWRWPFTGLYDMPGGWTDHWEWNYEALQREIQEEVWLKQDEFKIEELLTVVEDFVQHEWEWEHKDEHLIGIIYKANITKQDFDLSYIENGWDANGLMLMKLDDVDLPKTNMLVKALEKYKTISI